MKLHAWADVEMLRTGRTAGGAGYGRGEGEGRLNERSLRFANHSNDLTKLLNNIHRVH